MDESPIEAKFKSFSNGTKFGNVFKYGKKRDRIGFAFASNGSVSLDHDFGKMNGTGHFYHNSGKDSFQFDGKFVNGELKNGTMWGVSQEGKPVIKEEEKIEEKLRELRRKEKENEE